MKRQYTILTICSGWLAALVAGLTACEEFVTIAPPKTEIVTEAVFTSDASAMSAARGIYSVMISSQSFTNGALEQCGGILSDELIFYGTQPDLLQFYQNSLTATNESMLGYFWKEPYRYINNANALLEGLEQATGMSATVKNQLQGEAKFIRAFCHFHLVILFGDVPYITSTDYRTNAIASRMLVMEVLMHIEQDLLEAQELMVADFSMAENQRVQPNKGVATALLARLYLYMGEWEKAETEATRLIDNTDLYSLVTDLNDVFLKNSSEAIWQLQPVVPGLNTTQGQLFILTSAPNATHSMAMSQSMIDSFEPDDSRWTKWVGHFSDGVTTWYFPFKYKIASGITVTEYPMMFRLAEQYLIRAEARAQLEKISGAQEDLNVIRSRASLDDTDASDKTSLLTAIEHERHIELFAECGHRWFDLNRTDRADDVLGSQKPGWQSDDALLPIPESERYLNPNLTQNDGY